ncbi:MAG: FecR domain-containing protein, partial [Verrucomicrobia bacterium]|nr:FecR domain-containing protein [Verrucomicrobiota bacterium]
VVSYPEEETRLELAPSTRLEVLLHRDGKQLRLQTGSLSAEVSPQPEGRPMRLFSQGAEAVVLGTRFTLNADPANRELAVQKGAVRVNRAAMADSIVVSAEERVKLGAKSLELEPLPPVVPPRWRDEHTLALDFETPVSWPLLRCGRVVKNPQEHGQCLAGELGEVVRRHGGQLVLATSLRPQCVATDATHLKFRYWAASGIEGIEIFLYVFGVERAFKAELKPEAHDRWVEWSVAFSEMKSAAGAPPSSDATVRSISVHTSPVSGPLALYVDDVVLENVSAPPPFPR